MRSFGLDTAAIAKGTLRGSYVPLAKDLISPPPPLSPAGAVGRPLVGLSAQSKMQTIGPRRGGWSDRVKDAGGPAGRSAALHAMVARSPTEPTGPPSPVACVVRISQAFGRTSQGVRPNATRGRQGEDLSTADGQAADPSAHRRGRRAETSRLAKSNVRLRRKTGLAVG